MNNLSITNQLMKNTIAQLVIVAASLIIVSCGGKDHGGFKVTPAQGSVVLAFNESMPWDKSFELWSICLGDGGAGDTITVVSGPLGRSASFTITPELAGQTLENRVDIALADDGIVETIKLLKAIENERKESVSLPKLLTLVRENMASDTRRLMITSSTLNQDREEPAFSFNEGRYPSDGHLQATINETPFTTKGNLLSNVNVIWNDSSVGADYMNDIHRASVRRFIVAWIQAKGASIQFGALSKERPVALDAEDTTVEMRVAPTRSVRVVSQHMEPITAPEGQASKPSDVISESLKELNQVSLQINFSRDSADVKDDSDPLLKATAAAIRDKSYQYAKFVVEGHTSPEGTARHNQMLSVKRAASVREALIGYGVDANCLSTIGYGSSRPLYLGEEEASKSANRRVVLRIVDPKVAKKD